MPGFSWWDENEVKDEILLIPLIMAKYNNHAGCFLSEFSLFFRTWVGIFWGVTIKAL